MATAAEILRWAQDSLTESTDTPRLDAEILLAASLGCSRATLLARLGEEVAEGRFLELLDCRMRCEPLAYILGKWEFFSMSFDIEPPVLVPRPETEHLVEVVLERARGRAVRILELGAGSGCVAIALAKQNAAARVLATDIRHANLDLARRNAARHNVGERVDFVCADLFRAISDGPLFDIVCSNPPYVEDGAWETLPQAIREYEDPVALLAGPDGLDAIREIISKCPRYLRPGGFLALEIGMGQYEAVRQLLRDSGYSDITFRNDLAGIPRIAFATKT